MVTLPENRFTLMSARRDPPPPAGYGFPSGTYSAVSIYDIPYREDAALAAISGKDFYWRAYTFVVCVKNKGQDRILLSGVTYGFDREWRPATNDWGPAIPFGPKCTGIKSFPRGAVQDAIENDTSVNYDFRDEWIWDR